MAELPKKIPQIKKKISAYVLGEEGKISKQSIMTLGAFLGAAALGGILSSKEVKGVHASSYNHSNSLGLTYGGNTVTGTHTHSTSHNSHSSHVSHSSY